MNDFEKTLMDVSKPSIQADQFKHQLHRNLRQASERDTLRVYKRLFGLCAAAAVLFAAALITVIARPDMAKRLHVQLTGSGEAASVAVAETEALPANKLDAVRRMIRHDLAPVAQEEAMLEAAFNRQPTATPVRIKDMQDQIYTVRRYRLSDGREAVVYTELDNRPPQSY